jgi:hypothetical protein
MTNAVVNAREFTTAIDAFRAQCYVPVLVVLSEEFVATQDPPPTLALKVPQTSFVDALARPVLAAFSRFLAEPTNAPAFWLSRGSRGDEPVPWLTPIGVLAARAHHGSMRALADATEYEHRSPAAASLVYSAAASTALPLKLYANFRVIRRRDKLAETFPAFALAATGADLVRVCRESVLHALKRSVAIMNPNTFSDFLGELNPQDTERLRELALCDHVSVMERTEAAQFVVGVLGAIKHIVAWPVLVHSVESGRTLTLSVPAVVGGGGGGGGAGSAVAKPAASGGVSPTHRDAAAADATGGEEGGFLGFSFGNLVRAAALKVSGTVEGARAAAATANAAPRPAVFQDLVLKLAAHMGAPIDGSAASVAAVDAIRRRLHVGGLPAAPLPETPLRWLVENVSLADLAVHVLLLPAAAAAAVPSR